MTVIQVPGEIPTGIGSICSKCIQPEPKNRYESISDVAEDLRLFVSGGDVRAVS